MKCVRAPKATVTVCLSWHIPFLPRIYHLVLFAMSQSRKLCVWCSHHHLASGYQIFDHFYSKMSWATFIHRCYLQQIIKS